MVRFWVIGLMVLVGVAGVQAGCDRPPRRTFEMREEREREFQRTASCRAAARAFLREEHPDWLEGVKELPEVVHDRGEVWEVTWELPADRLGGVPVVEVEKGTGQVRRGYHTQ